MKNCVRLSNCILHKGGFESLGGFDLFVIPNTYYQAGITESLSQSFHSAVNGKPYRGTHLVPLRVFKTKDIGQIEASVAGMSSLYPMATAWDVVHEHWCIPWKFSQDYFDLLIKTIHLCRQYAPQSKLFLSEFRPQDRKRWLWAFRLLSSLENSGSRLDGISVQLHCEITSLSGLQIEWIKPYLAIQKKKGYDIHCYEVMVFDRLMGRNDLAFFSGANEMVQRYRYESYKQFAIEIGATLFGLWHPWDGSPETYWYDHPVSPGIYRADWSPKLSHRVFFPGDHPPDPLPLWPPTKTV